MVNFGLIDEWEPSPGRLVTWFATPESIRRAAAAPVHPAPPSLQQEQYLRLADRHSGANFRFSGLCLVTAELPTGDLDRDAMTRVINAFLLRHDTFRTWFDVEGGTVRRHLVPPDDVDFQPIDYGHIDDPAAIRNHVEKTTPDPFQWDCFTFGAIEHGESTTVYLAVDHLHTDGLGQYLSAADFAQLYAAQIWGEAEPPLPAASYLDYCVTERAYSDRLTLASPGVKKWLELVRGNDNALPTFPLDLGKRSDGYQRSAHRSIELLDTEEGDRFEQVCRANGAEFVGGAFAAAALAERDLTGSDYYFGMTPISTRTSAAENASVGWYVTLVPVAFPLGRRTPLSRALTIAQRAYENGLRLAPTSFHRVLELLPADSEIKAEPGWVTPMISFIDARDFVGHEFFDEIEAGVFANRAASEEVLIWINRLPSGTSLSVIFPDTAVARESVGRYLTAMKSVFPAIAAEPS
ncbi:condensation domain-containing protein [Nocardia rhizosphaerihabitans]|uniref:Conserved polyketide synthase associated protein PapA2 n=1 Tax=Nocardia rhizosphaerihabitans TaxID=1691570 RepID=A0ABQ2KXE5_9NOCA|nr:condensation domain-containing protein [Nocardia rhizosphaerihabitans]GGN95526.1 putative conserved polyketide synthase associated protein PapA2 [Nocardia rhizosphaerihabitans]